MYPECAQRRFLSDYADAQAGLKVRCCFKLCIIAQLQKKSFAERLDKFVISFVILNKLRCSTETICMACQIVCSSKNKKFVSLPSDDLAHRMAKIKMVKVNCTSVSQTSD